MNCVQLTGRLTKDVELKMSQAGVPFVQFTIAVNRQYSQSQEADFINCVAWRANAENMSKYVGRGALIAVVGKIQVRKSEFNGSVRYYTEVLCDSVEFLESKAESEARRARQEQYQSEPEDPFARPNLNNNRGQLKENNIFDNEDDNSDIKNIPSDVDVSF